MCRYEGGFTLIELMVVVVIVGVLSAISVYMFSKQTAKAKSNEVRAVFAELKLRQEQMFLEQGNYTCLRGGTPANNNDCSDTTMFPNNTPGKDPRAIAGFLPNSQWTGLNMNLDKPALLCSYAAVWGSELDATNLAGGNNANSQFGFTAADVTAPAPQMPDPWYYLIAQCNLDGDSATNSWYFMRSDRDGMVVKNPNQ